jgi:hypothetical protein
MGGINFGWLAVWVQAHSGSVTNWKYATFVRRLVEAAALGDESAGRVPLCIVYPGICLTTEEKSRKNLSQGNRKALG